MMAVKRIAALHERLLALGEDGRLLGHLGEPADDLLVPVHEAVERVGDAHLVAELLYQFLRPPQVVSRDARV